MLCSLTISSNVKSSFLDFYFITLVENHSETVNCLLAVVILFFFLGLCFSAIGLFTRPLTCKIFNTVWNPAEPPLLWTIKLKSTDRFTVLFYFCWFCYLYLLCLPAGTHNKHLQSTVTIPKQDLWPSVYSSDLILLCLSNSHNAHLFPQDFTELFTRPCKIFPTVWNPAEPPPLVYLLDPQPTSNNKNS